MEENHLVASVSEIQLETDSDIWYAEVLTPEGDLMVFFEGEENCFNTHLLGLGFSQDQIEYYIKIFKNVKLSVG